MAEGPGAPTPGEKGFWPEWLTPRRVWIFLSNVARLERQVQQLQNENNALRAEMSEVRLALTDHEAQLRLLTSFVRDSLSNRLEAKIEQFSARVVERDRKQD